MARAKVAVEDDLPTGASRWRIGLGTEGLAIRIEFGPVALRPFQKHALLAGNAGSFQPDSEALRLSDPPVASRM